MSANLVLDSALMIGRVSSRCEEKLFSEGFLFWSDLLFLKLHACTPTSEKGLVSGSGPDMFYANTTISQVSLRIHSLMKNLPHDVRFL